MSSTAPDLLPNATRDLAAFATSTRFEDIPSGVVDRIKLSFMDGVGVCLFGATLPWTRVLSETVLAEGGAPVSSLWTTGRRVSVSSAVLVNSTAGHAFEMDDIHKESILHPNSLGLPVAVALAEANPDLTGRDICAALALGYEVGIRIGNAATSTLFLNGFHPQGTTGAFVAAVTAGRLLGLDAGEMQNAMGIAGSLGAGLMAAQEGAMVKRLHAGRAAQGGVLAAMLAAKGFTGISHVVEAGYGGFLSSFARTPNVGRLMEGLGKTWEAGLVGFKMYPNVTSIHSSLDALQSILGEHKLRGEDIEEIGVGCGRMTFVHTAWDYRPVGITAAQMNMFYGLAVMALRGDVTAGDYAEDRIAEPEVLDFIPRIKVSVDDEIETMGPAFRHAARLTVRTLGGRTFSHEVLHRRASPENPVTAADIERKFDGNVRTILSEDLADELKALIRGLDRLPDAARLSAILAGPA